MSRILVIIILAFALFFFAINAKPLVLGMSDKVFISPKRPAMAFTPNADMWVVGANKLNIFPEVQDNLVSVNNVLAYYAYYTNEKKEQDLLCLLAVNEDEHFTWLTDTSSTFEEFHKKSRNLDGHSLEIVSFVLPKAADPFQEYGNCEAYLVRRYTMFTYQRKAKIIVEYREIYHKSELGLEVFADPKANADFEERADAAFTLTTDPKNIPEVQNKFIFDQNMARRNALGKYVGKTTYLSRQ